MWLWQDLRGQRLVLPLQRQVCLQQGKNRWGSISPDSSWRAPNPPQQPERSQADKDIDRLTSLLGQQKKAGRDDLVVQAIESQLAAAKLEKDNALPELAKERGVANRVAKVARSLEQSEKKLADYHKQPDELQAAIRKEEETKAELLTQKGGPPEADAHGLPGPALQQWGLQLRDPQARYGHPGSLQGGRGLERGIGAPSSLPSVPSRWRCRGSRPRNTRSPWRRALWVVILLLLLMGQQLLPLQALLLQPTQWTEDPLKKGNDIPEEIKRELESCTTERPAKLHKCG